MIIFISIPSKGLFSLDDVTERWFMKDHLKYRLAELHEIFPNDVFVVPSIQNYVILPFMDEGTGPTYDSWKDRCHQLINASDMVMVLKAPHWDESVGVRDEIAYATEIGVPVTFTDW